MLEIKPLDLSHVPLVAKYLNELSDEDFTRMGIESQSIPSASDIEKDYQIELAKDDKEKSFFSYIWLVDSKAVGYSTLKDIEFAGSGSLHLHMWSAEHRGKGYGPILFCKTVAALYEQFSLQSIICEPKADNPMPNRLLEKVGFKLVGTRLGASSALSKECELNTYRLDLEVAIQYLQNR